MSMAALPEFRDIPPPAASFSLLRASAALFDFQTRFCCNWILCGVTFFSLLD
jgi:hypothetical protein